MPSPVNIAPAILKHYPSLNAAQRAVVGHLDGPLLVIAGPGSGKTHSIVLRALNLLLLEKATPKQLVLCTFTEKAAFELRGAGGDGRRCPYLAAPGPPRRNSCHVIASIPARSAVGRPSLLQTTSGRKRAWRRTNSRSERRSAV